MKNIILNGTEREIAGDLTIADLMSQLEISAAGTAIAVNGEIVSREFFESHVIEDGDSVDMLRAIGGG